MNFFLDIISGRRTGVVAWTMRTALSCLTPVYRFGAGRKNARFDGNEQAAQRVSVPVISIGNLTTGGTGKTPLAIWLAQHLLESGKSPALISRGYGARNKKNRSGNQHELIKNDEAMEIEARIPNIVQLQNPDRVSIARKAIDEHSVDTIVLDDGFQHRRLARDLDIVLIDATCPFGYGHLLPRGLLREPISSVSRANGVIITRAELVNKETIQNIKTKVREFAPTMPIAVTETSPVSWMVATTDSFSEYPLDALKQKKLHAFCAIGNPDAFQKTLVQVARQIEAELTGHQPFPDHHIFTERDLNQLAAAASQSKCDALICTHKDLVKIRTAKLREIPLFALAIGIKFREGEEELMRLITKTVSGCGAAGPSF